MSDILAQADKLHDSLSPAPWSVKPIQLGDIEGEPCLHDAANEMTGIPLENLVRMRNLLPELIAEVKRLGEVQESGPHAISVAGKTFLSIDVDEKRLEQLSARDAEIERWQQIAKEERCKVITLIEKLQDVANNPTDWQTRGLSKTYEEYITQAAQELEIESKKIVKLTPERQAAVKWAAELAGDCKAGDELHGMLDEVRGRRSVASGGQAMTLLDEVARLREMDRKSFSKPPLFVLELAGCWSIGPSRQHIQANNIIYTGEADAELFCGLRNAAPAMLEVLSMMQEGDAEIIYDLLADWVYSEHHPAVEVLRRHLAMAAKMEGKE